MKTEHSGISAQAKARMSGRHAGTKAKRSGQASSRTSGRHTGTKTTLSLLVLFLVAGCVNVHVHFPPAPESTVPVDTTKAP